ncbi:MAG: hypothetical protein Tsb0021_11740 [Chlamydiales bacterium]
MRVRTYRAITEMLKGEFEFRDSSNSFGQSVGKWGIWKNLNESYAKNGFFLSFISLHRSDR